MVRRLWRPLVVATAALLLGGAGTVVARADATTASPSAPTAKATPPKVVVIVGPAGAATPYYRTLAEQTAVAAEKLTPDVVRVYSPDATWERVRSALQGASLVVYLGHGNGWPSIYHDALFPGTEDGFGLNPHSGAADQHQYFGEARIAAEIHLARDAVVVFSHLCYASGNSEPGLPEGTLDVAQQRVDNYAAGFLEAGAGAVIADAYLAPEYYVTSVLRGRRTIDSIWRAAPNRNGHFLTFPSARTKGAVAWMDPEAVDSGFIRSLVARPRLTSGQVLGNAQGSRLPVEPPVVEPSLAQLGVTFGAPDLAATPVAGTTTKLELPLSRAAAALLPRKILVSTRWDRLDVAPTAPNAAPAGPPAPPSSPSSATSGTDATPAAGAPPTAPDLVVAEAPGEVVAPVAAKRLSSGGWYVAVRIPTAPGLYRLVATLHGSDGLAFDAATQALVPALVVRVIGPASAMYAAAPTASAVTSHPLDLAVAVSNLGRSAWGHPAGKRMAGPEEVVVESHATLVARWVSLGATGDSTGTAGASVALPPGMAPRTTVAVELRLVAPRAAGDYLVVLDVVDADGGSLAALGVPPGIVRVHVGS
ncbi:MAG TPA: hypothetical protein VIK65_01475 [Candidatus Limnocylindrales bacterium]|jgi:hypothetical protein